MTFIETSLTIIIILLILIIVWSRVMHQTVLDSFKEVVAMIKEVGGGNKYE